MTTFQGPEFLLSAKFRIRRPKAPFSVIFLVVNNYTVKSRCNEWPPKAYFGFLIRNFMLNRDFLM